MKIKHGRYFLDLKADRFAIFDTRLKRGRAFLTSKPIDLKLPRDKDFVKRIVLEGNLMPEFVYLPEAL